MNFDPADPYPLLGAGARYEEERSHSEQVDAWLGLRTHHVEAGLAAQREDQQLWIGLPMKSMLTPYSEMRAMLERLQPPDGSTVVDLGAGYGRMGFVMGRHWPRARFLGYEWVEERVLEGRRCLELAGYTGRLVRADLSAADFSPEIADFYFIYDYGTRAAIEKTIEDLRLIALAREFVVVGRGRATRDTIERRHPWLSQVVRPEHCGNFTLYRVRERR